MQAVFNGEVKFGVNIKTKESNIMPINELVEFCAGSINKDGKCMDCEHNCSNNCNICLQECHFGSPRVYDCNNMIYCYSCSYSYKYASEIGHLFNNLGFNRFEQFNILNLGCGSCADLFGVDRYLSSVDTQRPVSYVGVDNNERWLETHNQIKTIFPQYNIKFINSDIFDFLDDITDDDILDYNFVILQYILNEFNLHCRERIEKFTQKIIDKLPGKSIIITNDINHYDVRSISAKIFNQSKINNLTSQFLYRFPHQPLHDYGGVNHPYDNLMFDVPEVIEGRFDIKRPCSSAQSVIFKTRNR